MLQVEWMFQPLSTNVYPSAHAAAVSPPSSVQQLRVVRIMNQWYLSKAYYYTITPVLWGWDDSATPPHLHGRILLATTCVGCRQKPYLSKSWWKSTTMLFNKQTDIIIPIIPCYKPVLLVSWNLHDSWYISPWLLICLPFASMLCGSSCPVFEKGVLTSSLASPFAV